MENSCMRSRDKLEMDWGSSNRLGITCREQSYLSGRDSGVVHGRWEIDIEKIIMEIHNINSKN